MGGTWSDAVFFFLLWLCTCIARGTLHGFDLFCTLLHVRAHIEWFYRGHTIKLYVVLLYRVESQDLIGIGTKVHPCCSYVLLHFNILTAGKAETGFKFNSDILSHFKLLWKQFSNLHIQQILYRQKKHSFKVIFLATIWIWTLVFTPYFSLNCWREKIFNCLTLQYSPASCYIFFLSAIWICKKKVETEWIDSPQYLLVWNTHRLGRLLNTSELCAGYKEMLHDFCVFFLVA